MKQKYILLILLVIIISTTSLSVLAVTPNLELTPSTQSVGVGNQATVNIVVEDVTDLRGANITLNFDASKLQYVSSAAGSFIPDATLLVQSIDNTNGTVILDIAGFGTSAYASGSGTIMTVVFERMATGNTDITFGSTTLRDKDNITITHTKGNGCLITFCIGDFGGPNGFPDNHVDFEDLMIFAIAYGSTPSDDNWNPACDLYPDGKIDFEDLMIFAMHYGDDCGCTLLSAPNLSDPGTTVQSGVTYTVSWSEVTEATSYVLQEATSPDFSGAISYPLTGASKTFSHTVTTTTTYYYQVAAVNSCGQSVWSNVEDIIVLPDSGNKVFLESGGTLNGTSVNPSNPTLTVNSGGNITGTLKVQAIYSGPSSNVVPFGYTPSWGSHSSSYVTVVSDLPVGTSPYDVSINLNAPTTPGTYYLIFASNCEMNLGWTMSQTNWTTGIMSWDDGNDIADLTESKLQDSISTGYLYLDMLVGSTYSKSNYGIAYVKIEVVTITDYDFYNIYHEVELEGDYVVRDGYKIKVITVYSDGRVTYEIDDSVNVTLDPGQFYDGYDGGKLIIYHEFGDTDVNKVASWQTWTVNLDQKTITPDDLQVTQGQQDAYYIIQTPGNTPYNIGPAKVTSDGEYIANNWDDSWSTSTIDSTHYKALIDIPTDAPIKTYNFWLKYMHSGTGEWFAQKVQLTVNDEQTYKPTVTTQAASNIGTTYATANGTIVSDGGSNITERGFEYGLTQTPTWSVKETGTDLGTGAFSKTISGLDQDTTYWVKAYAVNNEGKSVNDDWQEFHTPPDEIIITNEVTFTCDGQQAVISDCSVTLSF